MFDWNTKVLFVWLDAEFSHQLSAKSQITFWDLRIQREEKEKYYLDLNNEAVAYPITDTYRRLR